MFLYLLQGCVDADWKGHISTMYRLSFGYSFWVRVAWGWVWIVSGSFFGTGCLKKKLSVIRPLVAIILPSRHDLMQGKLANSHIAGLMISAGIGRGKLPDGHSQKSPCSALPLTFRGIHLTSPDACPRFRLIPPLLAINTPGSHPMSRNPNPGVATFVTVYKTIRFSSRLSEP